MAKVRSTNKITYDNSKFASKMAKAPLYGVYQAEVVDTKDTSRTGRMRVFCASLAKDKSKAEAYIDCRWSTPFGGITDIAGLGNSLEDPYDAQTSYGMWMVPPDLGNIVLIAFGDGIFKNAYVIGCVFADRLTHMVPGMPYGKSYSDPSLRMPVNEKNLRDGRRSHNDAIRTVNIELGKHITRQGLLNDSLRGAGTSGSRRESPSEVFGILTPGPRDPDNYDKRLGGHQFIMDDNRNSRLIRLRTAHGTQLLLDDTTGTVYCINKKGTAWFEMTNSGDFNFYAGGHISMRAKKNFNIRADKNINFEAGNDVHVKAAGDTVGPDYKGINPIGALGLPPLGTGGNIRFEAAADLTQNAALNVQTTATGGDIDVSAGGKVGITASGPAKGIGGIQMFSLGPISTTSTQGISMDAPMGITMIGAKVMALGGQILLNTPGGYIGLPAVPAATAPQIGVNKFKDQPNTEPEFDEEAGASFAPFAPSGGTREGKQDEIETIVTNLVTAEPYVGHHQSDPLKDSGTTPAPSEDVAAALPDGAITSNAEKPLDNQTPEGSQQGTGYVDSAGNVISDVSDKVSGVTDSVNDTINSATGAVNDVINNATDAATQGAKDLLGGLPTFEGVDDVLNNFKTLQGLNLLNINSIGGLIAGLQMVLPPIRFPTSNALAQKVIGIGKQLQELEAQLKQFALDATGLDLELMKGKIGEMQNLISDAKNLASNATQFESMLKEKGISIIPDTPGQIFEDSLGNKLVDFSKGIGPIGTTLGAVSQMNKSFNDVKDVIKAPLNDNQTAAMTSFVSSIGAEPFRNSRLVEYMNDPALTYKVPREMQKWVLDKPGGTVDQSLVQRRQYEAQIWATPDEMSLLADGINNFEGGITFQQLADDLERRRAEFYIRKRSGNQIITS